MTNVPEPERGGLANNGSSKRRGKGSKRNSASSSGSDSSLAGHMVTTANNDRYGNNNSIVPEKITDCYVVEIVWKSTSYDRMQHALKTLAIDETCVSGTLYHLLMGHENVPIVNFDCPSGSVGDIPLMGDLLDNNNSPKYMPSPNESQSIAIRHALTSPLSLIQGPPGTGKTFTATSIVYHLSKYNAGQILVCAPSNVAVDHLAEKINRTGLKVVRVSAKTREADTPQALKHLFLHEMVCMSHRRPIVV